MFQGRSSLPEGFLNDFDLNARAYRKLAAVKVLDEPPCGGCPYTRFCASQPVACESFHRYMTKGFALRRNGVRPTRRWYARLFSD